MINSLSGSTLVGRRPLTKFHAAAVGSPMQPAVGIDGNTMAAVGRHMEGLCDGSQSGEQSLDPHLTQGHLRTYASLRNVL